MPEIGIVDTRNIIRAIQQKYDFDFSHFTLSSFRYALDRTIIRHHIRYPDILISRILEDNEFFDEFLFDISDSSLELFRDPDTWKVLRSTILPQLFDTFSKPNIWFPGVCNGQDFFSLLILLSSEYARRNVAIVISSFSEKILSQVAGGKIAAKQLESGMDNFEKVFPGSDIFSFLKPVGKDYIFNFSPFQAISFQKQNLLIEPLPERTEMIFFRNNLINYNSGYQNIILGKLTLPLQDQGFLVTGIKENIDDYISNGHNLKVIDKNEKVYKKINKS